MKGRCRTVVIALVAVFGIGLCLFFAMRWTPRRYRVAILPSLGRDAVGAHAINDRGRIVGVAQARDGRYHMFLWDREHGLQDMGVTGDARFDINNTG